MAKQFDYAPTTGTALDDYKPIKIKVINIVKPECEKACDPGNRGVRKVVKYSSIEDKPWIKFNYLYNEDGSFLKEGDEYLVEVVEKYKNCDRLVPAYRVANSKVLKGAELQDDGTYKFNSMEFITIDKNEVIFYEKVATAFEGELQVEFNDEVFEV